MRRLTNCARYLVGKGLGVNVYRRMACIVFCRVIKKIMHVYVLIANIRLWWLVSMHLMLSEILMIFRCEVAMTHSIQIDADYYKYIVDFRIILRLMFCIEVIEYLSTIVVLVY